METSKIKEEIRERLKQTDATINEAIAYLKQQGIDFQPGQWLTIKRYCDKFGIADPQTVTDWIARGVIPAENVTVIKEFHNTVMIKAVPYQEV